MTNLRNAALDSARFLKSSLVEVPGIGAFKCLQPTVENRGKILASGGIKAGQKDQEIDMGRMNVTAVLLCVRDPETNAPVFNAADEEALLNLPAGGLVDVLGSAVLSLMSEGNESPKA